jgi:hypothetical protein
MRREDVEIPRPLPVAANFPLSSSKNSSHGCNCHKAKQKPIDIALLGFHTRSLALIHFSTEITIPEASLYAAEDCPYH